MKGKISKLILAFTLMLTVVITLVAHERAFLNTFQECMITDFKDPASAVIVSISESHANGKIVFFKVSAKNSLGYNVTTEYVI